MKNPIICFMGLDGSGKSTGIEYVYEQLKSYGVKVKIVRAAYVVQAMSLFVKIGKKLLLKKENSPFKGDYRAYLENMRKQSQKGAAYRVFSALTKLEFNAQIFFRIKLNHRFGTALLVDRYIYDNAVTYAANLGLGREYMEKTVSQKWKRAPKPDMIIYIKTPVEVCLSRKDDIPDPLYLEIREPLYTEIADMYGAVTVAGDQDKQKMLEEVMDHVNKCFERKMGYD